MVLSMDDNAPATLVLYGKSPQEREIASSLRNGNLIRCTDSEIVLVCLDPEEMRGEMAEEIFQFENYMDFLSTICFGRLLMWAPKISSTHDVVTQNFCQLPIGTTCVADFQLKGRGRSKNPWVSPLGCLMFSFTIEMEDGRSVPLLQYVVSLAVTEAIKGICHQNDLPPLDVKIKWPNDLYLNGLKIGGVLCTSIYRSKSFHISAGIGLNVENRKPTTCLNAAMECMCSSSSSSSSFSSSPFKFTREHVMSSFFNKFEQLLHLFTVQGFQALEDLYYKTWLHSGQRVIVREGTAENAAIIQGLTSGGYLLAVDSRNEMVELHPDGNSFDFLEGLVKRRLG